MQVVEQANLKVNQAALGLTLHRQTIASFPNFFVYLARILILVCAGVLASRGINHPVGTIALSFAATASLSSTFSLTFVVTSLLESYAAAERIFKGRCRAGDQGTGASGSRGEIETIEFRDVTFAYPGTQKNILEHFDYIIKKGDRVGIAGKSGAGKSTILRLLLRFYAPTKARSLSMASRLSRSALRNCISVSRSWNRIPTCLTRQSRKILVLQSRMLRWKRSK